MSLFPSGVEISNRPNTIGRIAGRGFVRTAWATVFVLCTLLGVFAVTMLAHAEGPITIANCQQLQDMDQDLGADYVLSTDINCNGFDFAPVGTSDAPFTGSLDGDGKTISNLSITGEEGQHYVGLIGYGEDVSITNLHVVNADITVYGSENYSGVIAGRLLTSTLSNIGTSGSAFGNIYVGGVAGRIDGTSDSLNIIDNIESSVVVKASSNQSGGLFGRVSYSQIANVSASGDVIGKGYSGGLFGELRRSSLENGVASGNVIWNEEGVANADNRGGLVGGAVLHGDSISNSRATGDVYGRSNVGGFVGAHDDWGVIEDSYSTGEVYGRNRVGGFAGDLGNSAAIKNSFSTGDVAQNPLYAEHNSNDLGGFVGRARNSAVVHKSFSTGDVSAPDTDRVGGFVGWMTDRSVIVDSYSRGSAAGNDQVGGFIGAIDHDAGIGSSYSTGQPTATQATEHIGGFIGEVLGGAITYLQDVYWDNQLVTVPNDNAIVVGVSTTEMKNAGTFPLNFINTDVPSTAYQYLRFQMDDWRNPGNADHTSMGITAFILSNGNQVVEFPEATTATASMGWNADEIIDGNIQTSAELYVGDASNLPVWIDLNFGEQLTFDGYDWLTSNYSPSYDPASWTLLGSNNGEDWTEIDTKQDQKLTLLRYESILTPAGWDFGNIWDYQAGQNDGYPILLDAPVIDDGKANNGPDRNNDGTPDSQQPHVNSVFNPNTDNWVTLELDEACEIEELTITNESDNTAQDPAYDYTYGLVNFTADCGTPGYETTVTLYHYGITAGDLVVRKHNPNTNGYFNVNGATISGQTINNESVVVATFTIIDGGVLDVDGTANGVIVDPVGLATQVVGVPNTGLGGRLAR